MPNVKMYRSGIQGTAVAGDVVTVPVDRANFLVVNGYATHAATGSGLYVPPVGGLRVDGEVIGIEPADMPDVLTPASQRETPLDVGYEDKATAPAGEGIVGAPPEDGTTANAAGPMVARGDMVAPDPGTLTVSDVADTTLTLTVAGAMDDEGRGALAAKPYSFSTDNGATWSAYQAVASLEVTGLTSETEYTCVHRVKDAAGNVATGTAVAVTTTAA